MTHVYASPALVTGDGIEGSGWVAVSGDTVVDVARDRRVPEQAMRIDAPLVPGLVDSHIHGAFGVDLSSAEPADVTQFAEKLNRRGVTSIIATIASAPSEVMLRTSRTLGSLVATGVLDGLHLEGPFLSPQRRGAHHTDVLRLPDEPELMRLIDASGDSVRIMTIAPELPGAISLIRTLVANGIVAAIGHSNADAECTRRAVDAGASVATHLFNGMPPLHHRSPGIAGACLADDRVTVEVLADGVHLHDDVVAIVSAAKPERMILASDCMAAGGLGDGRFSVAGSLVDVQDGVARATDSGSLAGSTTTLDQAFTHLCSIRGISLSRAVAAASTTPARALGLKRGAGTLTRGSRADIIALTSPRRVMRAGRWLT